MQGLNNDPLGLIQRAFANQQEIPLMRSHGDQRDRLIADAMMNSHTPVAAPTMQDKYLSGISDPKARAAEAEMLAPTPEIQASQIIPQMTQLGQMPGVLPKLAGMAVPFQYAGQEINKLTGTKDTDAIRPLGIAESMLPMGLIKKGGSFGANLLANTAFSPVAETVSGALIKDTPAEGSLPGELVAGIAPWMLAPALRARFAKDALKSTMTEAVPFAQVESLQAAKADMLGQEGFLRLPMLGQSGPSLWERTIGRRLQKVADKVGDVELVNPQGRISKQLGGNTLTEWFSAAQDRAPGGSSNLLNKTLVESARVGKALEDASSKIKDMPLAIRETFYDYLKGGMDLTKVPVAQRAAVLDAMAPYYASLGTSKKRLLNRSAYEDVYANEVATRLGQRFTEETSDPMFQQLKQMLGANHDLTTAKGTRKFLDELITSPLVPQNVRNMALDMYNLPYATANEVGQAVKQSFQKVLYTRVAQNPNWVKTDAEIMAEVFAKHPRPNTTDPKKLKEWQKLTEKASLQYRHVEGVPELKDFKVHKDIAEGINDMNNLNGMTRTLWNTYFLNPWKLSKIVLNPPARIRDIVSNMIFADVAGANPLSPMRVDRYMQALKEARNQGKYYKEFYEAVGEAPGNWADVNMKELSRAIKHGASVPEMLLNLAYNNPLSKTMINVTQFGDQWVKLAKFIHNREAGMGVAEAAKDTMMSIGDFTRQTRAVKFVRDTALPFFGWQAHAVKTMAKGLMHHPVRTMKYLSLPVMMQQYALSQLGINEDDWQQIKETLPKYTQNTVGGIPSHVPIPFRDEKGRIQLFDAAWWIPGLQDMSEADKLAMDPTGLIQNPAVTLFGSLTNNKTFGGAPIWYDWEEPATKAAKAFGYIGQQLLPNWTPGVGTTWNKVSKAFDEDPMNENLTPMQAVGSQLGYKVMPFDEENQADKFDYQMQKMENEAKMVMNRMMDRSSNSAEEEKLLNELEKTLERIDQKRGGR